MRGSAYIGRDRVTTTVKRLTASDQVSFSPINPFVALRDTIGGDALDGLFVVRPGGNLNWLGVADTLNTAKS